MYHYKTCTPASLSALGTCKVGHVQWLYSNSVAYTAIQSHQYKLLINTLFCIFLQSPPWESIPVDREDDTGFVGPHTQTLAPVTYGDIAWSVSLQDMHTSFT